MLTEVCTYRAMTIIELPYIIIFLLLLNPDDVPAKLLLECDMSSIQVVDLWNECSMEASLASLEFKVHVEH